MACNYITDGRANYTFYATGETRPITNHIVCNSKNLICMVHFRRCDRQYIGKTKRRLKDRFNEHRRPVDRPTPSSRPTTVSDHFLSENHSPPAMELIPLEIMHSSRTQYAKLVRHTLSIGVRPLNLRVLTNEKKCELCIYLLRACLLIL